jgi:predicted secreted Zn-dependent protease
MRLRDGLKAMLAALMITAFSVPAGGETIIHKSVTYFSVGGKTASDLDTEMMRRGPGYADQVQRFGNIRHQGQSL